MVELQDGQGGGGGLTSYNEELGILYVCARILLHKAGFTVVNSMDDYF